MYIMVSTEINPWEKAPCPRLALQILQELSNSLRSVRLTARLSHAPLRAYFTGDTALKFAISVFPIYPTRSRSLHLFTMPSVVGFFTSAFHFFTAYYFREAPPDPNLKSLAMKNIVILGASFAGVSTAHRILKQASKLAPFKITLVSPNTDIYWNLAAPRAAIGVYGDEKVFQPIAPGFKQYGDEFEFIVGTAESFDVQAKAVKLVDGKILEYDFLILATGSRTKEITPFKGMGSTEETKKVLHAFREKVKESKTIVIAGGGPTGIELAAELAFEFGKKKQVQLVSLHRLEDNEKSCLDVSVGYPNCS